MKGCRASNHPYILCTISAFRCQIQVQSKFDLKCLCYLWYNEVVWTFSVAESIKIYKFKRLHKHLRSKSMGVGSHAEERRKEHSFNLLMLWYLWEIKSGENSIVHVLSLSCLCCGGSTQRGCTAIAVLPQSLFCWDEGDISLCSKEGASFYPCAFVFVLHLTRSSYALYFKWLLQYCFFGSSSCITKQPHCLWCSLPILCL